MIASMTMLASICSRGGSDGNEKVKECEGSMSETWNMVKNKL